jgi:hypothetical protein
MTPFCGKRRSESWPGGRRAGVAAGGRDDSHEIGIETFVMNPRPAQRWLRAGERVHSVFGHKSLGQRGRVRGLPGGGSGVSSQSA